MTATIRDMLERSKKITGFQGLKGSRAYIYHKFQKSRCEMACALIPRCCCWHPEARAEWKRLTDRLAVSMPSLLQGRSQSPLICSVRSRTRTKYKFLAEYTRDFLGKSKSSSYTATPVEISRSGARQPKPPEGLTQHPFPRLQK